jgi:hypothetical protein
MAVLHEQSMCHIYVSYRGQNNGRIMANPAGLSGPTMGMECTLLSLLKNENISFFKKGKNFLDHREISQKLLQGMWRKWQMI